jgi:short-subunit dehydrogenase
MFRAHHEEDLAGQVALVTGASRGLGLLLAGELAKRGCRLAICARTASELRDAAERLRSTGAEVLALPCDLSREGAAERLAHDVLGHYGAVHVLVNNAGIIQVGPFETMTLDDYHEAMDTMFFGPLRLTLTLLPSMRARADGRIVMIGSIGGRLAPPHLAPYAAAKFAVTGFSEAATAELAAEGISVTTVVPGLMRTGSHLRVMFRGRARAEYRWFGPAASLPLLSMNAERAARAIVRATASRRPLLTLSAPARAGALAHGMAPGATIRLLRLANKLLPNAPASVIASGTAPGPGQEVDEGACGTAPAASRLLRGMTGLGDAAARRLNQCPATTRPR